MSLIYTRSLAKTHNIENTRGFFGRRIGRPLKKVRKTLLDRGLLRYQIDLSDDHIHPTVLFPDAEEIWMEIGFGDGEYLAALIQKHPDIGFIGIEPFINGMANFLNRIKDFKDPMLKLHMDDALPVVRKIKTGSIDRLYILNPDPWPKTRHHKRRIINQTNLDDFTRILKPGGWLVMATDVDALAEWMVTQCSNHPNLIWTAQNAKDWKNPPDWWELTTRYAAKGLQAGRQQAYLVFQRRI